MTALLITLLLRLTAPAPPSLVIDCPVAWVIETPGNGERLPPEAVMITCRPARILLIVDRVSARHITARSRAPKPLPVDTTE